MTRQIRILHVVPSLDASYGGPSYSVPSLARALEPFGVASRFLSTAAAGQESRNPHMEGFEEAWDEVRRPTDRALGYYTTGARAAAARVIEEGAVDVVHLHSLWNHLSATLFSAAQGMEVPFVLSPRSELLPGSLEKSRLKKRVATVLYARRLLERAAGFHATDETERACIEPYAKGRPIVLAGNGIDMDLGEHLPGREAALGLLGLPADRRYVLYMSRLHARKGPDLLLEAATKAGMAERGWSLLYTGSDSEGALLPKLKARATELGLSSHVHFAGQVEGPRKMACLAAASAFALPTKFENFGNAITEAMVCGLPILTTPYTPWTEVVQGGAGWIAERNSEDLSRALSDLFGTDAETLARMGATPRPHLAAHSWEAAAARMAGFYRDDVMGRGRRS